MAAALAQQGTQFVFTLCGGHISPILVGAKARGIRVVDCRDEKNAVFAADAVARLTGKPGVAAVTAGPGVTNAVTALKNAQLAQSPLVLLGGATATILRGRGSLQDIDQMALMKPCTKWSTRLTLLSQLAPALERAFDVAASGVPGPVFVEIPVDLLYPEDTVRSWYLKESGIEGSGPRGQKALGQKALALFLEGHLARQFRQPALGFSASAPRSAVGGDRPPRPSSAAPSSALKEAARWLAEAERPALVVGSQAMSGVEDPTQLAAAIETLRLPVWLGGMARGLLGPRSELQFRHGRGRALREADLAIVAGFPFDFRLKYGQTFGRRTKVIAANLSRAELAKNRTPDLAVHAHPASFLSALAEALPSPPRARRNGDAWMETLRAREAAREEDIAAQTSAEGPLVDPLYLGARLEALVAEDAIMVADGGDFVATMAYILRPRRPFGWLDPGVYGTLGVGGGFALGASLCHPDSEVWLLYGDGSSAYSLCEFDTFVRHGVSPIAVVGTDASWAQIARDQVSLLGDEVGTGLRRTDYHRVAEGYGGVGLLVEAPAQVDDALREAKRIAKGGRPVLVNVHLEKSSFREGSISI